MAKCFKQGFHTKETEKELQQTKRNLGPERLVSTHLENFLSNWIISPGRDDNKKYFKRLPRRHVIFSPPWFPWLVGTL